MKQFKIILILSIIFYSCKKNNESKTSTNLLLVKTITSKIHKIDSSGYITAVDSFQYDNQNRVIKFIRIGYDTSFLNDVNGNVISMPNVTTSIATVNYIGSNSIPSSYMVDGQVAFLTANTVGQIITDSLSPTNVSRYFYSTGLVVGQFGTMNTYHAIDSTSIDANGNVTSLLVGGIYFPDSLNQLKYGRIASWKYTYGNISNPIFANSSASAIFFLFTNFFVSKYIRESQEYITYGPNSVIVGDEVSNYQNVVDDDNVIQKSINTANDEYIAWTYY